MTRTFAVSSRTGASLASCARAYLVTLLVALPEIANVVRSEDLLRHVVHRLGNANEAARRSVATERLLKVDGLVARDNQLVTRHRWEDWGSRLRDTDGSGGHDSDGVGHSAGLSIDAGFRYVGTSLMRA